MFEIKYIKQGFDGFESWLRVGEDDWIRIDVFLEYYLTSDVKITTSYKNNLKSYLQNVAYCSTMVDEYSNLILDESKFDYKKYKEWLSKEQVESQKAIQKLNEF